MSRKFINIVLLTLLISFELSATSVNGRFVVVKSDRTNLSLLLQINTNTGKDDMGGATIVLSFNKAVLDFNSEPLPEKDYKFHNFSGGNYSDATVTKPLSDKLWINIDLPKENSNKGTVVSGPSGWTDVVTLNFNVKNPQDSARVKWLKSNIFWQIYDGDNLNSWTPDKFTDIINAPASIELLSFTATLLDDNDVQLDWSTVTYADNAGYEVEKSLTLTTSQDGEAAGTENWEKIGFVESKGILNTAVNYTFTDYSSKSEGVHSYRLKSVNKDGSVVVLKEVEATIELPKTFTLEQNYPNPFNPSTKISYIIPADVNGQVSNVVLKVYDILGDEVAVLVNEQQEPGKHEVTFEANNLSSGVYLYRLDAGSFSSTKKMILLR